MAAKDAKAIEPAMLERRVDPARYRGLMETGISPTQNT
jgi:hypothetical protein